MLLLEPELNSTHHGRLLSPSGIKILYERLFATRDVVPFEIHAMKSKRHGAEWFPISPQSKRLEFSRG